MKRVFSMSPDGKYIVYSSAGNGDDIMLSETGHELSGFDLFDRTFYGYRRMLLIPI